MSGRSGTPELNFLDESQPVDESNADLPSQPYEEHRQFNTEVIEAGGVPGEQSYGQIAIRLIRSRFPEPKN